MTISMPKVSIPNGDRHYLEPYITLSLNRLDGVFQSPMGIGITSNTCSVAVDPLPTPFQSPMGIGITSNFIAAMLVLIFWRFQSPMGIGITSNFVPFHCLRDVSCVSIPNGDRHYLEPFTGVIGKNSTKNVSIPNGDRHYLEPSHLKTINAA